jgi:hypothetical protein
LLEEALLLSRDIGTRELMAAGLESVAWVAAACGQARRAARLCGAAEAMRAALGEEAFAAAWAAGRALPLDEAIALALEGHAAE